jgi:hypothetical protein
MSSPVVQSCVLEASLIVVNVCEKLRVSGRPLRQPESGLLDSSAPRRRLDERLLTSTTREALATFRWATDTQMRRNAAEVVQAGSLLFEAQFPRRGDNGSPPA